MTTLILYNSAGDGFIIDLKDQANIYLTKQFTSIADFSIQGGYSQSFRIPMTERNSTFFSPLWNPNNLTFDFGQKITAELQVDSLQLEKGYLQVQKVYSKGDMWHELDVQFFSTIPNLSAELKDKKLKDIQDLPNLNHEMIFANVNDPFSNGVLLYGLTDKGQKWSENADDISNLGARSLLSAESPLYVNDLTPFVQSSYLFEQILSDAGFTYESSVLGGLLDNYYIPFVAAKYSATEEQISDLYFSAYSDDSNDFITGTYTITDAYFSEFADNGGNLTSNVYTAMFAGDYFINIKLITQLSDDGSTPPQPLASTTCTIRIKDNTTGDILWYSGFNEYFYESTFESIAQLTLQSGQSIKLEIVFNQLELPDGIGGFIQYDNHSLKYGSGWWLNNTSITTIMQEGNMDVVKCAPDYKQVDFIRDIIKMHNLVIIPSTHDANHLMIEPMTIYLGSGNTIDWTKKIDLEKDIVLYSQKSEQSKTFKWTYSAGTEYLSTLFVNAGRIYGDYVVNVTNNDFANGENNVQLTAKSTPLNEINGTNIPIPKFINENSEFVVPGARILYLTPTTTDIVLWNDSTSEPDIKTIKLFSHYSELNPSVTDYDLNFAPETPLQSIQANPYNNLWNLYWRRYYNELYGDESRTMEAYFLLDYIDYINIGFDDIIYIKDSYWRLLSIENFAIDQRMAVKCKLIKYSSSYVEECGLIPSSLTNNRQVLFSDGVDDDLDGNQGCCELYGYNWNTTDSKCYAIGPVSTRPSQVTISNKVL